MKKIFFLQSFFLLFTGLFLINFSPRQKSVSELTIVYDYTSSPVVVPANPSSTPESATYTIYIKGNMTRSEMSSALYNSAIIYDANTRSGVILKEVSGQKLLIRVSAVNWSQINKPFESLVFVNAQETK